jgi:hypothetical protein
MRQCAGTLVFIAILMGIAISATSQTAQPTRFDVASIKVNVTDVPWRDSRENCQVNGMGQLYFLGGGRVRAERALIPCILADAYNVRPYQVLGGPAWVNSVYFDVDAKPATATSGPQQIRAMLQALLADRFQNEGSQRNKADANLCVECAQGSTCRASNCGMSLRCEVVLHSMVIAALPEVSGHRFTD